MTPFQAFTEKSDKIESQLITKCYVSDPILEWHPDLFFTEFRGLWDTGATRTSISNRVATLLKLIPIRQTTIFHATGQSIVNVYDISIVLPNDILFPFKTVSEGKFSGFDVLIGMDIISQGDFSISNVNGKTTFSFRTPPFQEIDFVVEYDNINQKN